MRWALFLSGRGSTAQAVFDNAAQVDLRLVVSSKRKCMGVTRARRLGIPVLFLDKESSWKEIDQELNKRKIERIFLLGFMKILPADFVASWKNQIVNVHPSLLPLYPGKEAMEASHKDKKDMGVTVHVVTAEMDAGPVLLKKKVLSGQRVESLGFEEAQIRMSFWEQSLVRRTSETGRFL